MNFSTDCGDTYGVCPSCAEEKLVRNVVRQEFEYGAGRDRVLLYADVPVYSCVGCEENFTDEDAEVARHSAICAHLGRLSPAEIKAIRSEKRLTQDALATITGFGIASIKRWEAGNQIQSVSSDNFLRLIALPGSLERLASRSPVAKQEAIFRTVLPEHVRQEARLFVLRPCKDRQVA